MQYGAALPPHDTQFLFILLFMYNRPDDDRYIQGRSPAEIVGSNPTGGMDICLL